MQLIKVPLVPFPYQLLHWSGQYPGIGWSRRIRLRTPPRSHPTAPQRAGSTSERWRYEKEELKLNPIHRHRTLCHSGTHLFEPGYEKLDGRFHFLWSKCVFPFLRQTPSSSMWGAYATPRHRVTAATEAAHTHTKHAEQTLPIEHLFLSVVPVPSRLLSGSLEALSPFYLCRAVPALRYCGGRVRRFPGQQ